MCRARRHVNVQAGKGGTVSAMNTQLACIQRQWHAICTSASPTDAAASGQTSQLPEGTCAQAGVGSRETPRAHRSCRWAHRKLGTIPDGGRLAVPSHCLLCCCSRLLVNAPPKAQQFSISHLEISDKLTGEEEAWMPTISEFKFGAN